MRWLKELRNPKLKCERVGHREGLEFRKGYRKPDFNRHEYRYYVCVAVTEEREACLRCHAPLSAWALRDRNGLTGYSWPKDMADQFEKAGEYWQTRGFKPVVVVG